jgi:riboflavin biosynthesis pyrimidine reductase
LSLLGQKGVLQLMVEGGGKLLGALLEAKLGQHLSLYVGACALGSLGHPLFSTESIGNIKEAPRFRLVGVTQLGNSARLDYDLEQVS